MMLCKTNSLLLCLILLLLLATTGNGFHVTVFPRRAAAVSTSRTVSSSVSPLLVHHPLSTEDTQFHSMLLQNDALNDTMASSSTTTVSIQEENDTLDLHRSAMIDTTTTSSANNIGLFLNMSWAQPLSWWPLGLAAGCGMASAGGTPMMDMMETILKGIAALALVGPCWQGFAQTLDAYCCVQAPTKQQAIKQDSQLEVTAHNQHDTQAAAMLQQMGILLTAGMALSLGTEQALLLNNHVLSQLSVAFYALSVLSCPLVTSGWVAAWMIALSTTTLPWLLGHAMLAPFSQPAHVVIPILFSMLGLGSVIVHDFSLSHDDPGIRIRALLPMLDTAHHKGDKKFKRNNYTPRWTAVAVQDGIQVCVAAYLAPREPWAATAIMALLLPQMFTQRSLLFSKLVDVYKAFEFSQPFYLLNVMITAVAMGHLQSASLM